MRGSDSILFSPEILWLGITLWTLDWGARATGVALLESPDMVPETWPGTGVARGEACTSGVLTAGGLLCETAGDGLGTGAGAGAGAELGVAASPGLAGGALGALLAGVCCANAIEENNRTAAMERLESRIKHL